MIAFLTFFFLFAAFVLLLLVSLSVPIIHPIFLFKLAFNISVGAFNANANAAVDVGLWGYCVSAINANIEGFSDNKGAQCSPSHVGYTFEPSLLNILHINTNTSNIITKAITAALVIHPVACGLTFLAMIFALTIGCRNVVSRVFSAVTMILALLAALLSTIVFVVDIVFVVLTRNRIRDATNGEITLNWGNAVWMTLGAAIALWAATVGACCGICACGGRRRRDYAAKY